MLSQLLESVADIWAIWLFSCAVLSATVYVALRRARWCGAAAFFKDEQGASYALPYLMTFPFYLIFVCWVIQGTMILVVKIGVMHAAHCAARSAVVWRSADPQGDSLELARSKSRHAAVLALVPYASGLQGHRQALLYNPIASARDIQAIPAAIAYEKLYRMFAKDAGSTNSLANSAFVQRKFRYASAMTNVTLAQHVNQFNKPLSVEVRYHMPIHIPGTGFVMGTKHFSGTYYYREIRATATLPLETPESANGKLGIQYDPSKL